MDDQLKLRHDPVATARGSDTHSRLIEVALMIRSLPLPVLTRDTTAPGSLLLSPVSRALSIINGRIPSDESLGYFLGSPRES